MLHWKAALEFKYSAVPGITGIHDILISKKSGKVISYKDTCFNGEYTIYTTNMILNNYPLRLRLRINQLNSAEKLRQLTEQHRRYIKQDVPLYTVPTFLQLAESNADTSGNGSGRQQAETVYLPWL